MQTVSKPMHERSTEELLQAIDVLVSAVTRKTQTIMRMQQHMDMLFQLIESLCDMAEDGRIDELAALAKKYKQTGANGAARSIQ